MKSDSLLDNLPEHSDFEFADVSYPYQTNIHIFNGLRLAFVAEGEGIPLLFLHGQGASLTTFAPLFPDLIKSYKVYALDLPGFGKSDKPDPKFSREFYVNLVSDFIQNVIGEKTWLIGHSFGGLIALLFADENPQQLTGLTLVDPGGFYRYSSTSKKFFRKAFSLRTILATPPEVADDNFRKFTIYNTTPEVEEFLAVRKRLIENKTREFLNYSRAMIANLDILFTYDFVDKRLDLPFPVQIIWGANDKMIPIRSLKNARKSIPRVHIDLIKNSGHFPMLEQPEMFKSSLLKFLNARQGNKISTIVTEERKALER